MSTEQSSSRKLAAILFADIVGYTALMQQGEANAMSILNRFKGVTNEQVAQHRGEVIKTYGDGSLILFDSTVDAVQCAHDMQVAFREGVQVPLRIGIHVGEVIKKDQDIFGNGVNIAARVESMGIAGAVLMSGDVRRRIKNQEHLTTQSLGHYEFKNVEEPIEIFALTNEGFAIPKKDEITGKFKKKQNTSILKWLIPAAITLILMFGVWYWQSQHSLSLEIDGTSSLEPLRTPLSKEVRSKRVAVMVFDNQTNTTELSSLGLMANDWITKGLMEVNEGKVVNAANVRNQVALAAVGNTDFDLAKATGADVLITGRYYLAENDIVIYSNIVDAYTGDVIHALDPIQGDRSASLDLIDDLSQRIVGFWATQNTNKYTSKPPKYEAYRFFLEASDVHWRENDSLTEISLTKAYNIDSSYYEALLKLCVLYSNNNRYDEIQPTLDYIKSRNPKLSQYEQLRFNAIEAGINGKLEAKAKAYEDLSEFDPESNFMAGLSNIRIGKYEKALNYLNKHIAFDQAEKNTSWSQTGEEDYMLALWHLNRYQEVVDFANQLDFEIINALLSGYYLSSLVYLGRADEAIEQLPEYTINLKSDHQKQTCQNVLCLALYATNSNRLIAQVSEALKSATNLSEHPNKQYTIIYLSRMIDDYQTIIDSYPDHYTDGILRGHYVSALHLSGAQDRAATLYENWTDESYSGLDLGQNQYGQAIYLDTTENEEEAFKRLKLAYSNGVGFDWYNYQYDPGLAHIRDYPPFQEFVKPRG